MFERFTQSARAVVVRAQEEARGLDHGHIGTEHILLGLLSPDAGGARTVLASVGITRDRVVAEVQRLAGCDPSPLTAADVAALSAIGIDAEEVLRSAGEVSGGSVLRQAGWRPWRRRRRPPSVGHIPFTPRAKKVLELSLREALMLQHRYIGPEHILLGLLREGNGLAALVLSQAGVDLHQLGRATVAALDRAA